MTLSCYLGLPQRPYCAFLPVVYHKLIHFALRAQQNKSKFHALKVCFPLSVLTLWRVCFHLTCTPAPWRPEIFCHSVSFTTAIITFLDYFLQYFRIGIFLRLANSLFYRLISRRTALGIIRCLGGKCAAHWRDISDIRNKTLFAPCL